MTYDPFGRGTRQVQEREGSVRDPARDRELPFGLWLPDTSAHTPLIVYSHSSGGHRKQSSFLLEHLASHGYVVAAVDHIGNTARDAAERRRRAEAGNRLTPDQVDEFVARIIADRVPDLRFLIDSVVDGTAGDSADRLDPTRIGLVGYSFGGWAVLATPEVDERVSAIVALAPGGSSRPLPGIIPARLTFAWRRDVATLFLVAENDRFTPLSGQHELLERAPGAKRLFVLNDADHGHFANEVADAGASAEHAHLFSRGLALAHFDATLRANIEARRFLDRALAELALRGVRAEGPTTVGS